MKRLATAFETVRGLRGRLEKERALADALAEIARDPDDLQGTGLVTAARLAAGRTLPVGDPRSLGVGWSLMLEVMVAATSVPEEIVRACVRTMGDPGEAFGLLMAGTEAATARPGVPLPELSAVFLMLASSRQRVAKRVELERLFARATPLEVKYLTKAILGGLRVGAQEGMVERAIARAFGADLHDVRRAAAVVIDPGELAILARDGRLHEARLVPGHPVAFMLATPLETIRAEIDPAVYEVEDKIDGVRAQLHVLRDGPVLFARGLDAVTRGFPEVIERCRGLSGDFVLDGELMAMGLAGRPRPFQALQARLGRRAPTPQVLAATSVVFVAYDILAADGETLLAWPWCDRRRLLESLTARSCAMGMAGSGGATHAPWMLNAHVALDPSRVLSEQLEERFVEARNRGHEGLVLKRKDAPYEPGRRGQAWIKVKRAFATLDVVVTAVEEGHGRRAGVLSDYTFAVWRRDTSEPTLANVGKAYSGLTDAEIADLTRRFERTTISRFGGVRLVVPEVVIEVAFDGIQRSARHKSGYALRFPRIVRIREDKPAMEADGMDQVEALFQAQLETGHREWEGTQSELPAGPADQSVPPVVRKRIRSRASPANQLELFGPRGGRTGQDQ